MNLIGVLVGICVGELVAVGIAALVGASGRSTLFSFSGTCSKGNEDELSIQDIHINKIKRRAIRLLIEGLDLDIKNFSI